MNKIFLTLIFILILLGCTEKPPPTDEQMLYVFKENRDIFEKLLKMIENDGFQVVSMDPGCQNLITLLSLKS